MKMKIRISTNRMFIVLCGVLVLELIIAWFMGYINFHELANGFIEFAKLSKQLWEMFLDLCASISWQRFVKEMVMIIIFLFKKGGG